MPPACRVARLLVLPHPRFVSHMVKAKLREPSKSGYGDAHTQSQSMMSSSTTYRVQGQFCLHDATLSEHQTTENLN